MLEAGWFNKPFVGSRTGGIAEFIEDGINGYLFKVGNASDLAEKIIFIAEHPGEAKESALKLNKKVQQLCSCKEYFEKLTNIYQSLLYDDSMKTKD